MNNLEIVCSLKAAVFVLFFGIAFFGAVPGFAIEVDPGQDSTYCSGSIIKLGGDPTAQNGFPPYKYAWESSNAFISLSDPSAANPTVSIPKNFEPGIITFELTVEDAEGFTCTEIVVISIVSLGEIEYSEPYLALNGATITASLEDFPAGANITWSLEDNDIGCSINSETGVITSGNTAGEITVKATITNNDNSIACETTKTLCVSDEPCCEVSDERTFGPVVVTFAEAHETEDITEDGYCIYEDIPAQVELEIEGAKYSPEITVQNANVSWEEKTEGETILFRNVKIVWQDTEGEDVEDKLGDLIDVKITAMDIDIDPDGNVSGGLEFNVSLDSAVAIKGDILYLLPDITGSFTFQYAGENNFTGTFDMSDVEMVSFELSVSQENNETVVIATSEPDELNDDGLLLNVSLEKELEGSFTLNLSGYDVLLTEAGVNFDFNIFEPEIESFNSGLLNFTIQNIQKTEGALNCELLYDDNTDAFIGNATKDEFKAFGFDINATIDVEVNDKFEIVKVNFEEATAQHEDFDKPLENVVFELDSGALKTFNADDIDVQYKSGLVFSLSDISLGNPSLTMNAKVMAHEFELEIAKFYADTTGTFHIDSAKAEIDKKPIKAVVNVDWDGNLNKFTGSFNGKYFNYLTIEMEAEINGHGEGSNAYNFARFDMEAQIHPHEDSAKSLGKSGLKIHRYKGQLGYNWVVNPAFSQDNYVLTGSIPPGSPAKDSISIGLSIGLGTAKKAFKNVPLSGGGNWNNPIFMSKMEEIKITKDTPDHFLKGDLFMNKRIDSMAVRGQYFGYVKIPKGTGKFFKLDGPQSLEFETRPISPEAIWTIRKLDFWPNTVVNAKLYNTLEAELTFVWVEGHFYKETKIENIAGYMAGTYSSDKTIEMSFPQSFVADSCSGAAATAYTGSTYTNGFGIAGEIDLNLEGFVNHAFQGTSIPGFPSMPGIQDLTFEDGFEVNLNTAAPMKVLLPGFTCPTDDELPTKMVSIAGNLEFIFENDKPWLKGDVMFTLPGGITTYGNLEVSL